MIVDLALLAVGLMLLFFGGGGLIRGASELAARVGVSPLAVGLTVVAFGTSAPELVVSLDAALSRASDIAVGNVVGSNIANIGLILGLAAMVRPMVAKSRMVKIDAPLMIAVALLLVGVMVDGTVGRLEGGLLLVGLAAYVAFTFRGARRESREIREEFASQAPPEPGSVGWSFVRAAVGLGLLILGGHLLVGAAVALATDLGVSQAVIGLTLVAVGTSLPELSTSLVAAVKGHDDIGIGNAVGSNIFNVLGILGVTAVVHPPEAGAISMIDMGVLVAFSVGLGILLLTGRRLDRWEGAVLLAAYTGYSIWLFVA